MRSRKPNSGFIGSPQLRRTRTGHLDEYTHPLPEGQRANAHAAGPFCTFAVPSAPNDAGVYAVTAGDEVKYIGECEDLARRFGPMGYGRISPRNCHDDGQSTNCKLNALILEAAKKGEHLEIWFYPTGEHKAVEAQLLSAMSPPWNGRTAASVPRPSRVLDRPRPLSAAGDRGAALTTETFRVALKELLRKATHEGAEVLQVRAGDLHEIVGRYPGADHRMPMCCAAMRSLMHAGDRVVRQPPKGNGANLTIEYRLTRR